MSKILEVKDLSVTFTDTKKNKKQVLFDVDFEMEAGEILGLAGESGSGKSTIAKCILGMIPHQGEIHLEDKNPQMIFQDPAEAFSPRMKVKNIISGTREYILIDDDYEATTIINILTYMMDNYNGKEKNK